MIAFAVIANCGLKAAEQTNVIVYGNAKCNYCGETTRWLDSQNIRYTYRDVELYGTYQEEMFEKLKRAGFTSAALLPVLDIKGKILMKPGFDEIKNAMEGIIHNTHREKKTRDIHWRPQRIKSLKTDFGSVKKILTESDLIFYDDGSGSGSRLIRQIKKEQIPFTLRQMNRMSNAAYFDLCSRLASLGYGNTVLFPVIEVRDEMIMNPSIDEVKILLIEMIPE